MISKSLRSSASVVLLWLLSLTSCSAAHLGATTKAAVAAQTCPGVANRTCSATCQQHTCEALGTFYRASNNESDPWDNEDGWSTTAATPCVQLVAGAAAPSPAGTTPSAVYCSWYGVSCCTALAAAAGNCSTVNTVMGLDLPMNNLNVSLEDAALLRAVGELHACGLTVLNLEANNLSGEMIEEGWSSFINLRVVNFANAWIGGSIPTALRHMRNLTSITLSNNYYYGTLPSWLGELRQLESISMGTFAGYDEGTGLTGTIPEQLGNLKQLQELILQGNFLSGTVPPQLCQGGDRSSLVRLSLRANLLEGSATAIEGCGNLIQLDLSDNNFTGPLPASPYWKRLTTYQVAKNNFTGRVPTRLCKTAKMLVRLDVSHNQLSGHIPGQITLLSGLQTLRLGNNKFTGTMTENVYVLPVLKELDLSNNFFVGTVPPAIEYTYTLQVADFSNNTGMTGTLPPQMAFLLDLQRVSTVGTSMSCSGITKPFVITTNASCDDPDRCKTPTVIRGDNNGTIRKCSEDELLPCFLKFSDTALPREDARNLRCKYIVRKEPEEAKRDCADGVYGSYFLGDSVQYLPDMRKDSNEQSWIIDPSYYQFRECSCLQGFMPSWDSTGTFLRCNPEPAVDRTTVIIVSAISAVAGLALLAVLVLLAQLYLRTRPKWLRERIMQGKRIQGAPKCTKAGEKVTVSIVVTDVKDYSSNMRQYKDLMVKAMAAHNNILRKACHTHAGYVMDQEGDSWTVAFHEPQDAVAFSLQVQQALAQKVWSNGVPSTHTLPTDNQPLEALRLDGSADFNSFCQDQGPGVFPQQQALSGPSNLEWEGQAATGASRHDSSSSKGCPLPNASVAGHRPQATVHMPPPLQTSFSSSTGVSSISHSSNSGSERPQSRNPASRLVGLFTGPKVASRSMQIRAEQPQLRQQPLSRIVTASPEPAASGSDTSTGLPTIYSQGPEQQQNGDIECGGSAGTRSHTPTSISSSISAFLYDMSEGTPDLQRGIGSSLGSSIGSAILKTKRRNMASALMHRLSQMTGRSGQSSSVPGGDSQPVKSLRLAVRIGIASGPLPYGSTLGNCAVKHRAKKLVSDVAAGGQVLVDESTFLSIKDSLSVLGTVNEAGYDDQLLQQLMHAQVVGRLQRQVVCCPCPSVTGRSEVSFSWGLLGAREPQDYDHDAIAVHMGCYDVPDAYKDQHTGSQCSESDPESPTAADVQADLAVAPRTASRTRAPRSIRARSSRQKLNLYSIAGPGMRKWPDNTWGLSNRLSWADPVNVKAGWVQTHKGYFEAPSASQVDLMITPHSQDHTKPVCADVTMVFATVENGASFAAAHSHKQCHLLHKAILKVMQQQLNGLPGRDGYLSRAEESEFGYMLAFEQPHRAVQWCLIVQEALMYVSWPDYILSHPGFEEVLCPVTGLPLFRGPRLSMGIAEGQPTKVLPDHNGRANYYGGSINRAARYMDAAAHGGQVVTNTELLRKLVMNWVSKGREDPELAQEPAGSETRRSSSSDLAVAGATNHKPLAVMTSSDTAPAAHGRDQQTPKPQTPKQQAPMASAALQQGGPQHQPAANVQSRLLHELVSRSNSETAAVSNHRPVSISKPMSTHAEGCSADLKLAGRSKSFTAGLASYPIREEGPGLDSQLLMDQHVLWGRRSSADGWQQMGPTSSMAAKSAVFASAADELVVQHLGRFSFKGSGEYDMVQLLHAAIADRTFPQEPPKGKGSRVSSEAAGQAVEDLPVVQMVIPSQLAAARSAFVLSSNNATGGCAQ